MLTQEQIQDVKDFMEAYKEVDPYTEELGKQLLARADEMTEKDVWEFKGATEYFVGRGENETS